MPALSRRKYVEKSLSSHYLTLLSLLQVEAVRKFVVPGQGPRFRKRDRLAFLSRRALRNAKAMGSYIKGGQGRKRRDMARLVRGVFLQRGSPDAQSQMLRPDLPEEYLEEEGGSESGRDGGPGGAGVPEALVLVLKNLRVFGHFDNAMLLELVRGIEHVTLRAGEFLFRVGDPDENMFVVESGSVSVFCEDQQHQREHGSVVELKQVKSGEPIVSLLSFLEHLSGKKGSFRTISARAVAPDTRMIKFSFECFRAAFDKHPENLSRVVQVVMIRLQRVTFLALHQYMGLGSELLRPDHRGAPGEENSEEVQTEQDMRERASNLFRKALGLIDVEGLENGETDLCRNISLITCAADEVLVQEETVDRNLLLLVLRGCVSVSQAPAEGGVTNISGSAVEIHRAYVGGLLGQLQTLTAEPSFFTYRSMSSGTVVAALPAAKVRAVMARQPQVALALASSVISNLSPHVRSIDFSLEWSLLESGRALYKQDTRADSIYVVLSGRLRSVIRSQGGRRELAAEYGRGELTGIVETLMKTPHATTVIAVRDTEVAKLPAGLIDFIKLRFPKVLMTLIKLLGRKLQQSIEGGPGTDLKSLPQRGHHAAAQSNFSTVALIPITRQLPAAPFALELLHALAEIDPALRLTKDYVRSELGSDAFDRANDFKLSSWLAAQEDKHRIVLYQCDPELTSWTKLCVRHADVVFILLDSTHKRGIYPIEHSLEAYSPRTRKELIFLHREDVKYPTGTQDWLKDRAWINGHHHMRCPRRVYSQPKTEASYLRQLPSPPDVHSDFSRLARWVTGTSVGLVLGGGGARGCSHVGMVKAILEAGVPIDTVAGVSIGSFIGALWCQERDITAVTDKARRFSFKMNQWWRQLLDLTYPYTSYFSGRGFNTLLEEVFEARDIRDLWLPYFTVTTDITESAMRVHDYGSLWRYVRSSMSLAGYVPPLCDPHDGHLLLDGGYVNNLPADLMRARGARHIMAIDVGAQDEASFTNYGDDLSGFQVNHHIVHEVLLALS